MLCHVRQFGLIGYAAALHLQQELVTQRKAKQIPDTLIRRRIDSTRGTAAVHGDRKAWRAWAGANGQPANGVSLPYRERLAVEYLRAVWRLPLRRKDKLMCLMCILPVYYGRTSRAAHFAMRLARPWRWRWKPGLGIRQGVA